MESILKSLKMPSIVVCGVTLYAGCKEDESSVRKYSKLHEPFRLPIEYIPNQDDVFSITKSVSDDLELFPSIVAPSMYEYILSPSHTFARTMMDEQNKKYTTNISFLKDTQYVLSVMELYKDKMHDSPYTMNCNKIMEIWEDVKDNRNFLDVYSYMDFDIFRELNESSQFLQMISYTNLLSPILGFLIPVISMLLPFLLLKIQGVPITFSVYIDVMKDLLKDNYIVKTLMSPESISWDKIVYALFTIGLYFMQIYQNINTCYRCYKNTSLINGYLIDMREYISHSVKSMQAFSLLHRDTTSYSKFCFELNTRAERLTQYEKELKQVTPFSKSLHKFNDIGHLMKLYYKLHHCPVLEEDLRYSFGFAGYIDNMIGVYNNLAAMSINLATFDSSGDLLLTGQYYPKLKDDKYVSNDCSFDKNIIISGPNASGKSTLIKTTCLNIIFTQTFGCGFYETCSMRPYDRIHTYLNIPDTSGRDSLFQAESRRCKEIVDIIIKSPSQRHFCIFDELFSGTNPIEATKAGYAFLTYISKFDNVNFMLTTHYIDICKRFRKSKKIRNCRMKTIIDKDTEKITYTYKINRGISKVHGALDVLKQMDFPDEIIQIIKKFPRA